MREATAALAQMTDLLALVVAPPLGTARIHRVEALLLQPDVVMVIVITSAGDVTKRAFTFTSPVDPGLVEWASSYLNESLTGIDLGSRRIASKLADPALGPLEASFIQHLGPALVDLEQSPDGTLYVDGAVAPAGSAAGIGPAPDRPADEHSRGEGDRAQDDAVGDRRAFRLSLDRGREPAARTSAR